LKKLLIQIKKTSKSYLQGKCRQAGEAILDQELNIKSLTKEVDRLSEENFNLSLVKGKDNGKE